MTRREMRVARYCNWRINRQVNAEDRVLIERVQNGMARAATASGPLAAGEVALRSFGRRLRTLIPECSRRRAARGGLVAAHGLGRRLVSEAVIASSDRYSRRSSSRAT